MDTVSSSKTKRRPTIAWWNEECEREERIVRAEYRKHQRNPTNRTKLKSFQCRRAIKHRFFRKNTWNKFVNFRTPTKKVKEKSRKVNGNYKPRIVLPLDSGENAITSPDEIADTFADHYANISKNLHKKSKPWKNRNKKR